MTEAAQILSEELGKPIVYEPLPASDMRKLPIGQAMETAYFECIVRQMELLQAGKLPDFADIYKFRTWKALCCPKTNGNCWIKVTA